MTFQYQYGHDVQWLHTLDVFLLSNCTITFLCAITSQAGRQDIVILNDRQIRRCYSTLRQRKLKTEWQRSRACSPLTLCMCKQWLTPSLKQSHYKPDMTSVTLAIIRGQDSWPLLVTAHVAIGRSTDSWLAEAYKSRCSFVMLLHVYSIRQLGLFFSCCKLDGEVFLPAEA